MKLGFFASHGGSNFQAVAEACQDRRIVGQAAVLISNNASSLAMRRAQALGIPGHILCVGPQFASSNEVDRGCLELLKHYAIDLVVLCGYMKKIGPLVLGAYRGRIINTHPALLPKFGGKGMYGRNVHAAVIAAGESETGVTVHIVAEEYDTGPILAQTYIPVMPEDTPESLETRVITREHAFLVETVGKICRGEISLS